MAIIITDECINCGACEPECPNNAIYEAGAEWAWADGNNLSGTITVDGETIDVSKRFAPISEDTYFIVTGKCSPLQVTKLSIFVCFGLMFWRSILYGKILSYSQKNISNIIEACHTIS